MQAGYAIFNIEITNPEDYQPIKKIRLANANTNGIIIQGA